MVLAYLPDVLVDQYPAGTILRVVKPLYGIAESGVRWFATYQRHHVNNVNMSPCTYDPCLLIANGEKDEFGMVGMQTDDTLILGTKMFLAKEEEEIQRAKFRTKLTVTLSPETSFEFNGCRLSQEGRYIHLRQKGQGSKIKPIDLNDQSRAQRYLEQRARGAYIASICQPEAAFDLSVAAQAQKPNDRDHIQLNSRLEWQIKNLDRGLHFAPIDLSTAKLMVFTNGSFTNNQDLSSQLGYVLAIVNETTGDDSFTMTSSLIHWSSTKYR
ncbi:uncharacterized protein N7518_009140 [Penicillium psychrosexuale]|uniref:uncharacterized protein n=1 Tax=Penicillium psychrosexuale TaxID=1002107 RepID=UPI002544FDC5|nr:uncharacterized protein N7518_009140 [Penicillium psychrosexuale]KAJ5783463.1 hypothetical protein N7518_009140 [Penicillium psychrosexuale]